MSKKKDLTPEELYREERKKRLASEAKKKSKRKMSEAARKKVQKAVGITVAAVLCLGVLIALLNFFGVPQRLITAVTVDGEKFSVSEYTYYYNMVYNNYYSTAKSYEEQYTSYGAGYGKMLTGYDYTVSPEMQSFEEKDDDGNVTRTISYAEKFKEDAVNSIEYLKYYSDKAVAAGLELDADDHAHVEENIAQLEESAEQTASETQAAYSINRFIALQFGAGITKNKYISLLERQLLASKYIEKQQEDIAATVPDKDIDAEYEKDPSAYQVANIRLFGFPLAASAAEDSTVTLEYTDEQQKARANEMLAAITDEQSFITLCREYCTTAEAETFADDDASKASSIDFEAIKSNADEDSAKWVFDSARKKNDVKLTETEKYIYIIMIIDPAFRNEEPLVNIRHILVQFDDNMIDDLAEGYVPAEEGTTAVAGSSDDAEEGTTAAGTEQPKKKSEYKALAEQYLKEWQDGEKTEDSFAELAEEYSDDTASLSSSGTEGMAGGLYADVGRGQYVKAFEDWSFDKSRKPGDAGIIETEYGYHIMYFVSAHEEAEWKETIRNTLSADLVTAQSEKDEAEYKGLATTNSTMVNWAYKKVLKTINDNYNANAMSGIFS